MADQIPRFGASDFFLVETDPVALREQLRASLAALLGREVVDADPHMVLASAFMPYLVQGQASADACAKATLRAFAVGQDLQRIAESTCVVGYLDRIPARGAICACILDFSVRRSAADAASVARVSWSCTVELENSEGDKANFSGSGELDVAFEITDSLTKFVSMPIFLVCETVGPAFNGILPDDLHLHENQDFEDAMQISVTEAPQSYTGQTFSISSGTVSVYTCGSTYNGADEESDDAFALRASWQTKALKVTGSYEYYQLALSTLALLASWYIAPELDSEGRLVLAWCDKASAVAAATNSTLTNRGAAYDEFLNAVKAMLPVGMTAHAYPAHLDDDEPVIITVTYRLPAETVDVDAANKQVGRAWRAYVAAHAWHVGAVMRSDEIQKALIDAGAVEVVAKAYDAHFSRMWLSADGYLLSSQFSLTYLGKASAGTTASGSGGEDITP